MHGLKRPEEALACFDRALALDPNRAQTHLDRAMCLLFLGRWSEGWVEYEWRKRRDAPQGLWPGDVPPWTGREDVLRSERA